MGWFSKKEDEEKIPSLPELPKLPEFSMIKDDEEERKIHQLPSFPNSSIGQKFSQNTIKEAVTGGKEEKRVREINKIMAREIPTIPQPFEINAKPEIRFPFKKDLERNTQEIPEEFEEAARTIKKAEPVFIRIDKFEDSLNSFNKIKKQIWEIEKMLGEIKKIKEKEEGELEAWEKELKIIKGQIEKIDKNMFSKVQ